MGELKHVAVIAGPTFDALCASDGLPKEREIIAYCRGPYCVLSFEAVALLREQGYAVHRHEDGFPEWKAAGLPVERAANA